MIHICNFCKKEFWSNSSNRKYCSRECYNYFPRVRNEKQKSHISNITKQFYNQENIEINKRRWAAISKGKSKTLTPEEILAIEKIYKLRYIIDDTLVLKKAGIFNKSKKILQNYSKENKAWRKSFNLYRFVPLFIQKFDEIKFIQFQKDSENLNINFFCEKYKITEKSVRGLINRKILSENLVKKDKKLRINRKETSIEYFVRQILNESNIKYEREYFVKNEFGKKFYFDFYIPDLNKIIEVHGDYWHANPSLYNENTVLSNRQKENIIQDIKKQMYCKSNNIEMLIIWEQDIYINPTKVKNIILEYASK